MTNYYRQKLVEAVRALVDHGDLNTRLTYAAGCLLQIDDDDVPVGALERFEFVRDPVSNGEPWRICRCHGSALAHAPQSRYRRLGGRRYGVGIQTSGKV